MKRIVEQRKEKVLKLLRDYEVKIIVSPYSATKNIEFSRLKIKQFYLPLNSDYSMTNRNEAMNGILAFAKFTNDISEAINYQLPFECIIETENAYFLFMQKRIYLRALGESIGQFAQFLAFLHYNILSICCSQQMEIREEDVIYAYYFLLKCTERETFGDTRGVNLSLSFASVRSALAKAIGQNPPVV